MLEPICIVLANLTPFSLQAELVAAAVDEARRGKDYAMEAAVAPDVKVIQTLLSVVQ